MFHFPTEGIPNPCLESFGGLGDFYEKSPKNRVPASPRSPRSRVLLDSGSFFVILHKEPQRSLVILSIDRDKARFV